MSDSASLQGAEVQGPTILAHTQLHISHTNVRSVQLCAWHALKLANLSVPKGTIKGLRGSN